MLRSIFMLLLGPVLWMLMVGEPVKEMPVQEVPVPERYSVMVFNIVRYIEWGDELQEGDFSVGIYGNEEMYKRSYYWYNGKKKKAKTWKVIEVKEIADLNNLQVIFVAKDKMAKLQTVLDGVKGKKVLVITETTSYVRGVGMSLPMNNGVIQIQINKESIENRGLLVATALSNLSR